MVQGQAVTGRSCILVQPDLIGHRTGRDKGVEVTIAIQIAIIVQVSQGHAKAVGTAQVLAAILKRPTAAPDGRPELPGRLEKRGTI